MEIEKNDLNLIDYMICPGFLVKDGRICKANEAARRLFLEPGTEVSPMFLTGREELDALAGGCLYLSMNLGGIPQGVTVTRLEDGLLFLADAQQELGELKVLALAAQELRLPLSNVMLTASRLEQMQQDEKASDYIARLNRGTSQLMRIIGNMSDALRYVQSGRLQVKNITSLMDEVFQKAQLLVSQAGLSLHYTGPKEDIFSLADPEQLERAVYNLISNSLKFTPQGGCIDAQLTKKGKSLRLTIQDSGSGIAEGILQNVFRRYLRQPSLEDSRFGLGLGLTLVRAAAANHGGTVLIDRLEAGTRITLTMAIRSSGETAVRSPVLSVDYAGERDHGLIELSESLPADLYRKQN